MKKRLDGIPSSEKRVLKKDANPVPKAPRIYSQETMTRRHLAQLRKESAERMASAPTEEKIELPFNSESAKRSIISVLIVNNDVFKRMDSSLVKLNLKFLEMSEDEIKLMYNDSSFLISLMDKQVTANLSVLSVSSSNLAVIKFVQNIRSVLAERSKKKKEEDFIAKRKIELLSLANNAALNLPLLQSQSSEVLDNHKFHDHSIDGNVSKGYRLELFAQSFSEFFAIEDYPNYLTNQIVTVLYRQYGILAGDANEGMKSQDIEEAVADLILKLKGNNNQFFIGSVTCPSACVADTNKKVDIVTMTLKNNDRINSKLINNIQVILNAYTSLYPFHDSISLKSNITEQDSVSYTPSQNKLAEDIEEKSISIREFISKEIIEKLLQTVPDLSTISKESIKIEIKTNFAAEISKLKYLNNELISSAEKLESALGLSINDSITFNGVQVKTSRDAALNLLRLNPKVPVIIGQSHSIMTQIFDEVGQITDQQKLYRDSFSSAITNLF